MTLRLAFSYFRRTLGILPASGEDGEGEAGGQSEEGEAGGQSDKRVQVEQPFPTFCFGTPSE